MELTDIDAVAAIIPHRFNAAQVEAAEAAYPALSPDQSPDGDLMSQLFGTAAGIGLMELHAIALVGVEREFIFAAAWHSARGRPELAEKYKRLAAAVRAAKLEKLN